MWQIKFCPRCGARVSCTDRFCGACGLNLTSVVPQVPPPSCDYQCLYQQWVPHYTAYNQAAAPENAEQCQQRYVPDNDRDETSIRAEISRMMGDLFDKHLKYNKT